MGENAPCSCPRADTADQRSTPLALATLSSQRPAQSDGGNPGAAVAMASASAVTDSNATSGRPPNRTDPIRSNRSIAADSAQRRHSQDSKAEHRLMVGAMLAVPVGRSDCESVTQPCSSIHQWQTSQPIDPSMDRCSGPIPGALQLQRSCTRVPAMPTTATHRTAH